MTYPNSSDVSAGQPTYASHYNNLRKDALTLGQAPEDSRTLADLLTDYAANLNIIYLATNRLRVTADINNYPAIMIGGCMLRATGNKDLAAGSFSGAAATWYIHAVRSPGSLSFTIAVSTTATKTDTMRVIGSCYWDGSSISSINAYYGTVVGVPAPNYDSGWFAVTTGTVYTKTHGLGAVPRLFQLLHSTNSTGTTENVAVVTVKPTANNYFYGNIGFDSANAYIETSTDAAMGVLASTRRISATGYYRIMAWL